MKKHVFAVIVLSALIFTDGFSDNTARSSSTKKSTEASLKNYLYPISDGSKWGYMDKSGKIIIEPIFEEAWFFSDNLANVKLNGKWGYINPKGDFTIEPMFDDHWDFENGVAWPKIGGKQYLTLLNGEKIVKIEADYTMSNLSDNDSPAFRNGLLRVFSNGRYGFIDTTGKWVVEPKFIEAYSFSEGLAPAAIEECKIGYIDVNGNWVIKPQFISAKPFSEGLAFVVNSERKRSFINKKGKTVLGQGDSIISDGDFFFLGTFSEGLVAAGQKGIGYLNKNGDWVIKENKAYKSGNPFSNGRALVELGGNGNHYYAFIDKNGEQIGDYFEFAYDFSDGFARVKKIDGGWGLIDKKGNWVIQTEFGQDLMILYDHYLVFSEGLAVAMKETKFGFINQQGQWVINPSFKYAYPINNGLALVLLDDDSTAGYINSTGEFVVKWKYNQK